VRNQSAASIEISPSDVSDKAWVMMRTHNLLDMFERTLVDLDEEEGVLPQETFDAEHVHEQIGEWSQTAIDCIFGLFTKESLRYVCLFVNKYDRLLDTEACRSSVRHAFSELEARIQRNSGSANFEVIVGSAKRGDGKSELYAGLASHGVQKSAYRRLPHA
jgi:hypothetical protein